MRCEEKDPKCSETYLHLCRHSTISSRDTKDESIIFSHLSSCDHRIIWLGRSAHCLEDVLTQSFSHLVNVARGTTGFNTLLDCLSHSGNMAIHTVVDNRNLCHGNEYWSTCFAVRGCWIMWGIWWEKVEVQVPVSLPAQSLLMCGILGNLNRLPARSSMRSFSTLTDHQAKNAHCDWHDVFI